MLLPIERIQEYFRLMSRDGDLKRWNIVSTKKSDLIRRKKIRQRNQKKIKLKN
jgi:hypothetical protein